MLESVAGFRQQAVEKQHICTYNGRGNTNTQVITSRRVSQFVPLQSITWVIKTKRIILVRTTIRNSEKRNAQITRQNSEREEDICENLRVDEGKNSLKKGTVKEITGGKRVKLINDNQLVKNGLTPRKSNPCTGLDRPL
jgi:hypothetical protein